MTNSNDQEHVEESLVTSSGPEKVIDNEPLALVETVPYDDDDKTNKNKNDTLTAATQAHSSSHAHALAPPSTWAQHAAANMARNPCRHFVGAWILALLLSVLGMVVGEFAVAVDNAGWTSRGTLIADRHTQVTLLLINGYRLRSRGARNEAAWEDLLTNVQPGWESDDDDSRRYLLEEGEEEAEDALLWSRPSRTDVVAPFTDRGTPDWGRPKAAMGMYPGGNYSFANHHNGTTTTTTSTILSSPSSSLRSLQDVDVGSIQPNVFTLSSCDLTWYTSGRMTQDTHLWPVWQTMDPSVSALDPRVLRDICVAETNTHTALVEAGLCRRCNDAINGVEATCLPPYSLALFARYTVGDVTGALSCDDLATEWEMVREVTTAALLDCVQDIRTSFDAEGRLPDSCPAGFHPALVDDQFGTVSETDGEVIDTVRYTSSIFNTNENPEALFEAKDIFDRAENSEFVEGAYDTQYEDFNIIVVDDSLVSDMILALASAGVTAIAILIHTRSPWLTFMGLFQIILSFPLAYFMYNLVARLDFFPFLNFIGVFVVFALGADDIFVAVDKWKNTRLDHPGATTEQIAVIALPDAGVSMFLTTITTAVAFFGTAICPVAPIKMFAIFNGLLISFDYFLCVILMFPSICLYDIWQQKGKGNCCVTCEKAPQAETQSREGDGEEKESLIRRVLLRFYESLHFARWGMLVFVIAAFVVSGIYASTLQLPNSSDVRLLSNKFEFEKNYEWRTKLYFSVLDKQGGSRGYVAWGVVPGDDGNQNDPNSFSRLLLDDGFDPSSEASQMYMLDFCEKFFQEDFATLVDEGCSFSKFNSWLQNEANSTTPSDAYISNCDNASELPVTSSSFNACIIAWSEQVNEITWIYQRNGVVEAILLPYQSRVRFDSNFAVLDSEWNDIESWIGDQSDIAPSGVNAFFSSSEDFWWYDTNGKMLDTAYGAAGIALGAAAIVMLVSSRSFEIMFFALFTIGFILLSVTAMLVATGWTLGFLESVCFAILIGISCDFVIHFGHAYTSLPGERSRHERSKYALLRMGPSILAAFVTTVAAAIVMLFTVISFFQKFAQILFFTVLMATTGSFVVFITLSDTLGPSQPTKLIDSCCNKGNSTTDEDSPVDGVSNTKSRDAVDEEVNDFQSVGSPKVVDEVKDTDDNTTLHI